MSRCRFASAARSVSASRKPCRPGASLGAALAALALLGTTASAAPQGFGASTPGGSGKTVYRVTNLNDSGPGSLRDAVSQGGRMVQFAVGGTITLQSPLSVEGSYITIDGTSAPSPGITLRYAGLRLSGTGVHNVIVRGIRIRKPTVNDSNGDGLMIKYGAHHILVEHVSVDGCGDGNLDVTRSAHDVTIAWSVFSNCAKNMLIKYEANRVTLHHNVFVASQWRNPWISNLDDGSVAPDTTVDMRNNIIWNWGDSGGGTGIECGAKVNVVNNFYFSGATDKSRQGNAIIVKTCSGGGSGGLAYTAGNVSADPLTFDINRAGNRSSAYPAAFVDTRDACTGAHDALAGAGAEPLDAIDLGVLSKITLPCKGSSTPTSPTTSAPTSTDTSTPTSPSTPAGQILKLQIPGRADDGEEKLNGKVALGSKGLRLGRGRSAVAFRFPDVTIPKGATILSAKLRLFAGGKKGASISIAYCGESIADSAALDGVWQGLSSRSLTSACIEDRPSKWSKGFNDSPELAPVLQEIVDRSGWTSGNDVTFLVFDRGSAGFRKVFTYDKAPVRAATLEVEWE